MIGIERIEEVGNSDVKTLLVNDEVVVAAGREGKIRIYDHRLEGHVEIEPGQGYINCIAIRNGLLFAGCQNGSIVVYLMDECRISSGDREKRSQINPFGFLRRHSSNVCCLDTMEDLAVSSSWDCTVIIWRPEDMSNERNGLVQTIPHPAVVWSAKFINKNTIVTGCGDKLIRIFKDGALANTFNYHLSYVRGVTFLDKSIVSVDNEGIVLKTSLDGRILRHHSTRNFMYSISSHSSGDGDIVICTGENGKVVIFDKDLEVVQEISVPTTSCWAATRWNDRVYVGGSDGRLYVYSSSVSDEVSEALERIRSDRAGLPKDGEFVSDGEKFKVADGFVYQEVNGEWVLLGKGEEAKPYDNTFQVELENKYYTLSFNNDENVYEVAEKFLRKNKLRDEFRDDIVDFIKRNFVSLQEFRMYSKINVNGVKTMLNKVKEEHQCVYPYIFRNLESPKVADNAEVEKEIKRLIENGPMFMALDLIRYFTAHKYSFDLSFLSTFVPRDKKEAITFVRLLNNLFADPPFNLEIFYHRVLELKDRGVIEGEVLDDYFVNRSLRNGA
ncbi:hypothetical protein M970_091750 [Encephalitozoon cuniculi EcunIII-L]|uniref:Ubiquitin-dependent proteolysis n=1 Tax=Encephalitozoon cuniculi TaxID=6035 RepID=M1K5M6_ENCCN|nr:ubiquitin-dependent proteolysis [Encephalitozoon cuniculi]KMV65355.1 hypothetical protein M970_091750 [Encephalitozoon cuniculi EcunIII-L]